MPFATIIPAVFAGAVSARAWLIRCPKTYLTDFSASQ